jgi:molybdopterin-guanine dinucleotide biosynthesis protein A
MRSTVVLAGGGSTRFGSVDKALLSLGDRPMTRHVADRLAAVTDEVVVNCRPAQEDGLRAAFADAEYPVTFALDPAVDRGPVAGIRTGLAAASGAYAAVVACDMPLVDADFVEYLFSRADGRDGAVPRPDEFYEVTQAVYRREAMRDACRDALEAGESKVLAPLNRLNVAVVEGPEVATHADPRTFENVNTPSDFRAVADALGVDVDDGVFGDETGQGDAVDTV